MTLPPGDSELLRRVDVALAAAARRAGEWLACRPGCAQCCQGAFVINSLDALRLSAGMEELRTSEPLVAAEIERRARAWIAEYGADFPGDSRTGLLGDSEADRDRFEEFANEAVCPALDPVSGLCQLYARRPMTCRGFGPPIRMDASAAEGEALGHCELCFVGASTAEVAACEMKIPHEAEARLLDEIALWGETVVAFALLR